MNAPECPSCRTAMDIGVVLDRTYGGITMQDWVDGIPESSFWTGLKVSGRERHTVVTYRCPSCHLLQSFAPPA